MKDKPGTLENMTDHKCENCAHWGEVNAFSAYGMDFCCREDSSYYNSLTNNDHYCKAWEEKENGTAKTD